MKSSHPAALSLAVVAWASVIPGQADAELSRALSRAAEHDRPVVLAVTMPYTRGSQQLARLLSDRRLTAWFAAVELLHFEQHHGDDGPFAADVAARLLDGPDRQLAAPQLIALDGQGKVLAAALGPMTAGQVEWFLVEACGRVCTALPEPSGACRALEDFTKGQPYRWPTRQAPPDEATMASHLEKAAKATTIMTLPKQGLLLARCSDPVARRVYANTLGMCDDKSRIGFLERIAQLSPEDWHEVVSPWVLQGSTESRRIAARALETFAEAGAAPVLEKALKKKNEPALEAALLRALAASVPADAGVCKRLHRVATARKGDAEQTVQAMLAAVPLEDRAWTTRILDAGLAHSSPQVRRAAAYAIALRRDLALQERLEALVEGEADAETRDLMRAALQLLAGEGSMAPFSALRKSLAAR